MAVDDETLLGAHERRRQAFEAVWPPVEAKLRRVLAARRVPRDDHDDLVQEVAIRALSTPELRFESPEELLPWARTVLRRLHIDTHRRAQRVDTVGEPHDAADAAPTDVVTEVTARLDLDKVVKVIATWSPESRQVLLSTETEGTRQSSSYYVQRHRLRAKLLAIVDGLGALWGNVWRRVDVTALMERVRAMEAAQPALANVVAPVAAACALALFLGAVTTGGAGVESTAPAHRGGAGPGTGRAAASAAALAALPSDGAGATQPITDASPGARDRGRAAAPAAKPRPDRPAPPVADQRVAAPEAAGYESTVAVQTEEGPKRLWCYSETPLLGEGCVGHAIMLPV